MRIDLEETKRNYTARRLRFGSGNSAASSPASSPARELPSIWRYDYLLLANLGENIRSLITKLPAAPQSGRALDLGGGSSPYRSWLLARGYNTVALDIDPLAGAEVSAAAERLPFVDESFDVVLCTEVLEHVRRPRGVMEEISRVLKPGGRCIVSAPHVWFFHPHPHDFWRFTPEGLDELCRGAGIRVDELVTQGGSIACLGQMLNFFAFALLGRWGAPLYGLGNSFFFGVDRLVCDPLLTLGVACLATKDSTRS